MPFQVVYNVSQVPVGIIESFTAGEDQVVVCATQITLQATIIGDTTGHTFEWDGPISGTAAGVTVTEANFVTPRPTDTPSSGWSGTTLYYINPAEDDGSPFNPLALFDDKVWRFFIDRGTAFEQFDDVTIFGTPISNNYFGIPEQLNRTPRNAYLNPKTGVGDVFSRVPRLRLIKGFGDANTDGFDKETTLNFAKLLWTEPLFDAPLIQYEVQERTGTRDPWVTVAIIPDNDFREFPSPNIGSIYRVVAITRESNSAVGRFISNTVFVDASARGNLDFELSTPNHFSQATAPAEHVRVLAFDIELLTLLIKQGGVDFDASDAHFSQATAPAEHVRMPVFDVLDLDPAVIGGGGSP